MKNYKLVDKTPYQAAGLGAIAGASMGASTVGGALIGGAVGAGVGLVAGGVMALKDRRIAKEENPGLRNTTQFGKK
jgi:hypothetical protein